MYMPFKTEYCEMGFSAQNSNHTHVENRLTSDMLYASKEQIEHGNNQQINAYTARSEVF